MATSTLNPNAPIFVPLAFRAVEDFSDQWWDLVHSSPWFRDYWLQDYYCFDNPDPQIDFPFSDVYDHPDFLFDDDNTAGIINNNSNAARKEERGRMDLISLGLLKWRKPREAAEMVKHCDKAPKIVNVRVSPRPIKQPR